MTAQPIHHEPEPDPRDPAVILERLPERERPEFRRQYDAAMIAARDDVTQYKALKHLLRFWGIKAAGLQRALAGNPRYYEDLAAEIEGVQDGSIPTVPIEDALAGLLDMSPEAAAEYWQEKRQAAHAAHQSRP